MTRVTCMIKALVLHGRRVWSAVFSWSVRLAASLFVMVPYSWFLTAHIRKYFAALKCQAGDLIPVIPVVRSGSGAASVQAVM